MYKYVDILIRLRKEDVMTVERKKAQKLLSVNGVGVYYLPNSLFLVKRRILGTVLRVQSVHSQFYIFENGGFADQGRKRT